MTTRQSSPAIGFSSFAQSLPPAALGLICAGYVALSPVARPGLEALWAVPLAFTVCVTAVPSIISFHRGGVGLKVLYCIVVIRYLVVPVLVAYTGGQVGALWVAASREGYRFAVAVTVAELFACCLTIRIAWPRYHMRAVTRERESRLSTDGADGITLGGLLLVLCLTTIIAIRGFDSVMTSFGFFVLKEKHAGGSELVDSYAVTAIQVLKSFLFVGVAVWCRRRSDASGSKRWFYVALVAAVLNAITYFGYNRSIIVQTGVATVATLGYLFPTQRKQALLLLTPAIGAVLYGLVLLKQYNVKPEDSASELVLTQTSISNDLEAYVAGPWVLATAFDGAGAAGAPIGLTAVVRGYTDNFFPFKIPGLQWPNELFSGVHSVIDIYQAYTWPSAGAMLPLSGEMIYYGGLVLGSALALLAVVVVTRLLIFFDQGNVHASNAQQKFMFSWMAVLFGLFMCYCSITLVWSASKFALFLALIFWANNRVFLRTRRKAFR